MSVLNVIRVGDIVKVKSGSILMTVRAVCPVNYTCRCAYAIEREKMLEIIYEDVPGEILEVLKNYAV